MQSLLGGYSFYKLYLIMLSVSELKGPSYFYPILFFLVRFFARDVSAYFWRDNNQFPNQKHLWQRFLLQSLNFPVHQKISTNRLNTKKQIQDQLFYRRYDSCDCPQLLNCNGNSVFMFLFWELRGLSPNFHIHVAVSDLYIPRIRPHISSSSMLIPCLISQHLMCY